MSAVNAFDARLRHLGIAVTLIAASCAVGCSAPARTPARAPVSHVNSRARTPQMEKAPAQAAQARGRRRADAAMTFLQPDGSGGWVVDFNFPQLVALPQLAQLPQIQLPQLASTWSEFPWFPSTPPQRPPEASRSVKMFKADWCGPCRKLSSELKLRGIPFTAIDVDQDRDAYAAASAESGAQAIPLTQVTRDARRTWVKGAAPDRIEQLYNGTNKGRRAPSPPATPSRSVAMSTTAPDTHFQMSRRNPVQREARVHGYVSR